MGQGKGGSSFSGASCLRATLPSPSTPSAPLVFLSPPGVEQTPKHPLAASRGPAASRRGGAAGSPTQPLPERACSRLSAACSCLRCLFLAAGRFSHPGAICSAAGATGAGGRPPWQLLSWAAGAPATLNNSSPPPPKKNPPPPPPPLCPQELSPTGHGAAFYPQKYRDQQHHLRFFPHLLGHGEGGPGEGHPLLHRPQQEGEQELQQVQASGEPGGGMRAPPAQGEEKGFWGRQ